MIRNNQNAIISETPVVRVVQGEEVQKVNL